ncbi:MAG: hypothetical protein ACKOBM_18570, partial [Gammaproteobacteria bacterium]
MSDPEDLDSRPAAPDSGTPIRPDTTVDATTVVVQRVQLAADQTLTIVRPRSGSQDEATSTAHDGSGRASRIPLQDRIQKLST